MRAIIETLNGVPFAGLMAVVTLGYLLGKPAWRGLSLGPAGGTLFVGLLLGHLGLRFDELYGETTPLLTVGGFGFALFIYSVGFEAASGFFTTLRGGRAWRVVTVGAAVNLLAVGAAIASGRLFLLDPAETAGVLAGALTSAPAYAAACEVAADTSRVSLAFALTYPFGLVAMALLVQVVPRLGREDLAGDADAREEEIQARRRQQSGERESTRAFEVARQNVIGKSLAELSLTRRTGSYITWIFRQDRLIQPDASTQLEAGDHILAIGRVDELRELEKWVGPEVYDEELRKRLPAPRRVVVLARTVLGKSLAELALASRFRSLVVEVERRGQPLEPNAELRLRHGDVLSMVGGRSALRAAAQELGRFEPLHPETDIAVYAGGILIGLVLASIRVPLGGIELTLGTAGGLLFSGLLLGGLGRLGPLNAQVPPSARQLVRDLGILLFVAEAAVPAGVQVRAAIEQGLWPTLLAGVIATLVPILGSLLLGRYLLRLRPIDAWGGVAGGMTSSAALLAVKRASDSDAPAVAFATAYAVSSVLVTLAGRLVVLVLD